MGWSRTRRTIVLRRRLKDVVGLRLSDERCVGRRSTGHFRGHEEKELAGDFKNAGREWRPKGDFEDVRVHDFLIKELGPAVPRGVYDLAANEGFVGVGSTTIRRLSLVQTLRRWWTEVGSIPTTTETGVKVFCELDPNPTPRASPSPTTRWPLSISPGPISTANGITPSNPAQPQRSRSFLTSP